MQVGITTVSILTGLYSGAAYSEDLAAWVSRVYPPIETYAQEIAFAAIVVVMTYISLVLGELVPKRLAYAHADRWATLVAIPDAAVREGRRAHRVAAAAFDRCAAEAAARGRRQAGRR